MAARTHFHGYVVATRGARCGRPSSARCGNQQPCSKGASTSGCRCVQRWVYVAGMDSWVSVYDYVRRMCVVTRSTRPGHHWAAVRRDAELSDPEGGFEVLVTDADEGGSLVVSVVIALDETGALARPHPDFDDNVVGSLTIWPYRIAGSQVDRFVWWSSGGLWRCEPPRPWDVAKTHRG